MKTIVFILSIIILVLLCIVVFLCILVKEKHDMLKKRFTPDQIMNAWCALYHDSSWDYNKKFFTEGLSLRDFLFTARLGNNKINDSFIEKCRKINRIKD